VKVLVVARVIFQRRNPHPTHACRPPRLPLGGGAVRSEICGSADIPERLKRNVHAGGVLAVLLSGCHDRDGERIR